MSEISFEKEIEELEQFLKTYPEASWRSAATMYVGYISLLKPVKTLFGAEYQCHPTTYKALKDMGGCMSDWISVEDRLPPPDADMVQYLGWVECPYYKGTHKIVTWHTDRFVGYPAGATNVTHWMLLPAPSEE